MMDNDRALRLAKDAYTGSTSFFDTSIRPQLERDLRMFQSRHGADSKYHSEAYRTRSKLFRPKTRAAIRNGEAAAAEAFFSSNDTVSVEPTNGQDPAQQASAEVMKALLQYRLTKSIPWFLIAIGAYQDAMVTGSVASYQSWEYDPIRNIDRPSIELLPLENLRFDPAASWVDPVGTSPYIIQLIPMYLKDVKRRMQPDQDGTAPKWFPLNDNQLISAATQTHDSTRMLREDARADSRNGVTDITDFSIVWVHRNIIEDEGQDVIYYTLGEQFLLSAPVLLTNEHPHGRRPYVVGCAVLETHKAYPSSLPKLVRDVQVESNEIANQRIDNVKLALNKRYFVKRNKQVDIRSLTRNTPGSVTLMLDPAEDVKVFDTPDVTGSSYQEQDRLNLDFDELAGNFSTGSVQSNRRLNETVGGMTLLTDSANKLGNYQLKTFVETWVEPVLRQLVLLEQYYETDAKILALAGKEAQLFQRFGIDQPTDDMLTAEVTLTVAVGMGTTSPSQRINNLMTGVNGVKAALEDGVLERYGIDPTEVIKEVFGALGYKNGGRFFRNAEDPRIAGMQQKIEQLQQQLEAKMPQAIVDATVRKMDAEVANLQAAKVSTGVTAAYAAMQAAEVIAAVPQVAPIADKVMQSAGYTAPTPPGIDPNYPDSSVAAGGAGPGLMPAAAEATATGPIQIEDSPTNTSPMFPPRAPSPRQGIETQRADSVQLDGGELG